MEAIRHDKWLEWCASLIEHTLIGNLWHDLWRIAGKKTATQKHPEPIEEENRLAGVFAGRASSENLPPATRSMQESLDEGKLERIEAACYLPDDTDCPFTIEELRRCKHKGKDTAPRSRRDHLLHDCKHGTKSGDIVPWPHKQNMGSKKRPMAWNDQDFQPIPKPKDPMNQRPIALRGVLGKNTEKNDFSKSKVESRRTTHQFVCEH